MSLVFRASLVTLFLHLACLAQSHASETDQFTYRNQELRDLAPLVDRRINDAIQSIVADWKPKWGPDREKFVRKLRLRADGRYMFNRTSLWILKQDAEFAGMSKKGQKHPKRSNSIYASANIFQATAQVVYGLAPTLNAAGVRIGTDKLCHFISGGAALYARRFTSGMSMEELLTSNRNEESGLYGKFSTGTFSNADLVANYEGFLAMQDLFDTSPWTGKEALLGWDETQAVWTIRREFQIADYLNPFWDEAINPSDYTRRLYPVIAENLKKLCNRIGADELAIRYTISEQREFELSEKYRELGLNLHPELRLDRFCAEYSQVE